MEGCGKPHLARGMCSAHYWQWWRREQNPERKGEARERSRNWRLAHQAKIGEYRLAHREEQREYDRKRYLAHQEEQQEYQRNYYSAHREELIEYYRNYRLSHREYRHEQYLTYHEEYRKYQNKWALAHPEGRRSRQARRRARKANTVDTLTTQETATILAQGCLFRHLGDCDGSPTLAHDIPISKGGNTTEANLFCLCARHNSLMRTKSLSDLFSQLALM